MMSNYNGVTKAFKLSNQFGALFYNCLPKTPGLYPPKHIACLITNHPKGLSQNLTFSWRQNRP